MKKRTFIISLIIPLLVGAISAFITNNQMETYSNLNTPLLAPPGWLFPIVWTLLYILIGISSYFIYISHDPKRENALIVYSFQLFINFCWPLFFFNLHNYFLSLISALFDDLGNNHFRLSLIVFCTSHILHSIALHTL